MRTNDMQLGCRAVRKTSATEINEIQQSSTTVQQQALRFETPSSLVSSSRWLTLGSLPIRR